VCLLSRKSGFFFYYLYKYWYKPPEFERIPKPSTIGSGYASRNNRYIVYIYIYTEWCAMADEKITPYTVFRYNMLITQDLTHIFARVPLITSTYVLYMYACMEYIYSHQMYGCADRRPATTVSEYQSRAKYDGKIYVHVGLCFALWFCDDERNSSENACPKKMKKRKSSNSCRCLRPLYTGYGARQWHNQKYLRNFYII